MIVVALVGAASKTLKTVRSAVAAVSDGANWQVVNGVGAVM